MKKMKKEEVKLPEKATPKKKPAAGVIFFCIGVMAACVLKGIQLDREEAANKSVNDSESDTAE